MKLKQNNFVLFLLWPSLTASLALAQTPSETLLFMKKWHQNQAQIQLQIEEKILKTLNKMMTPQDEKKTTQKFFFIETLSKNSKNESFIDDLKALQNQAAENKQILDFLDRLQFQIESHYTGQDLKGFLEQRLLEMALQDMRYEKDMTQANFMALAATALRKFMDVQDRPLDFLRSFTEYSGILHPKNPSMFVENRHYSNSSQMITVQPMSPEAAAVLADQAEKADKKPPLVLK